MVEAELTTDTTTDETDFSPERITQLTEQLASRMEGVIAEIQRINRSSHMLSVNARIESARAGEQGAAFNIVAEEMGTLSMSMTEMVMELEQETIGDFKEIADVNRHIATNFRGSRLIDMSLVNVDLVDRNLYERTCDCRWWATDPSLVDALSQDTDEARAFASKRMGIILDSYTVYFDLVLCNTDGKVIASGRESKYSSIGADVSNATWFEAAMATKSGTEYGFETVHKSPLVNNEFALVYSAAVRERGEENGKILGVLGVVFRYEELAQTVVRNTPLSAEDQERTRVMITDDAGKVLADSDEMLLEQLKYNHLKELLAGDRNFVIQEIDGVDHCIAHAKAPGYETYTTGWHSVIAQKL